MPTVRAWQAVRELHGPGHVPQDWQPILAALGVGRQVYGEVAGTGSAVQLRIAWVDLPIASESRPRGESFGPGPLFGVLDAATEWLIGELARQALTPEQRAVVFRPPAASPSALEYFAQSVQAARAEQPRDVVYYLERVAQYDPLHAPSQLMMAEIEGRTDAKARELARGRLRRIHDLAKRIGDVPLEIDVELAQAGLALQDQSFDSASLRLGRALELARRGDEPYSILAALNATGDAHLAKSAALTPRRAAGDPAAPPGPATSLAIEADLRAAAACFQEILERLARLGDAAAEAPVANKLALVHDQLGDAAGTLELHRRTLRAAERSGSRSGQATAWMFIGQWHRRQGQLVEAIDALGRCLELADEKDRARVRISLAGLLEQDKRLEPALQEYQAAYAELQSGEDLTNQLLCLMSIADVNEQLGRRDAAVRATRDAIDVAHVLGAPVKAELEARLNALSAPRP
jgi:tetratricopeptide (TPR) repeat protein